MKRHISTFTCYYTILVSQLKILNSLLRWNKVIGKFTSLYSSNIAFLTPRLPQKNLYIYFKNQSFLLPGSFELRCMWSTGQTKTAKEENMLGNVV